MWRAHSVRFRLREVVVAMLGAMMVACGGGGGDGPGPIVKLDLTVANRDAVSHAVIGGALGIGGADRAIPAGAMAVAQRRFAAAAQALRARPLASYRQTYQCVVSGSYTMTLDDRDGNQALTAGDVITTEFAQCSDTAGETVNGTMGLEMVNVLSSTDYDARSTFTSFATEQQQAGQVHRYTLDGTMSAAYRQLTSTQSTMKLTASGDFSVGLLTPVFSDTVKLGSGFVQSYADDTAAFPPSGTGGPGRSAVSANGDLHSAAAGGWVSVSTDAPMVVYAGDAFPREGALHVSGAKGVMHMTAKDDSVHVQRFLDWNDDGTVEDTTEVSWDWLV